MALLNTDFLTARTQTFRATRHLLTSALQEGVVAAGDYKVTPTGTSLQWSVAAGAAWVQGEDTTRQGLYHQVNDAAVTGLVAAGHATNPRIDQVILRIFDSSVTGVSDTPTLSTLAGTATGGATLDNRTGAAALPNGALRIADILVPALHSGVLVANTHIRDRRPWARGAYTRIVRNADAGAGSDYNISATGPLVEIDAVNLKPRIECSGVPMVATLTCRASATSAGGTASFAVLVDGVGSDGTIVASSGGPISAVIPINTETGGPVSLSWSFVPSAGSHQISWAANMSAGVLNLLTSTTIPLQMTVQEIPRQNANNS